MEYSFFSGLIQNVALLLVFSFLYVTKWIDSTHSNKLFPNIFTGIVVGGIGLLLINTPWTYQPGHNFDLRTVLLVVAGLYLGTVPTITAIIIVAAYRLYLGGEHDLLGVSLIIISGLTGVFWRYFQQRRHAKHTLISLYLLGLLMHVFMLLLPFLLPINEPLEIVELMSLPILIIYPIITVLLGWLMNRQLENWQNRKAKERLLESEQRFSKMMKDINMFFINADLEGHITFCNKYLLLATGYTQEELLGKNTIDIFIPLEERERIRKEFKDYFKNDSDPYHFEGKILTKDKRELYVSWHNAVITDNYGKVNGIACLGENITEKKAILNNLQEAKKKAEESNHLKSVFLQNISHEIRTPMNAIIGSINLLKDASEVKKTREQFYEVLEQSSARLLTTVNNLIDISQVETLQIKVNKTNFSLSEALTNYVDVTTPLAAKENNTVICTSKYLDSDLLLHTDKDMLNSIFINLLSNALKFTKNGTVEIGSKDENNHIVFYIKDTGIGIPKNRLAAIFDRFVQADSKLSRPHEGSGLGLSIAHEYAKLLGGNIWVESEEGKGSTFFFSTPKDEASTETPLKANEKNAKIQLNPHRKILIAEDDKLNFLCLKKIVEPIASTILHVKNGADAVETVRNDSEISLVLMDIKMPKMSGEEAVMQIRTFNKTIPIIAQTAFAMPADRDKYIEIGCNDYISKPIEKSKLIKLLGKYLYLV